jgi:hypothetical protein
MIVKTPQGYVVKSSTGRRLSKPTSYSQAVKRLRQVEMFKHMKK